MVRYIHLQGSERPLIKGAKILGVANEDSIHYVTLLLQQRPGGHPLPDMDYWQRTPVHRRSFPGPEEFGRMFGASEESMNSVEKFVKDSGLEITESHPGRCRVVVKGTIAQLNRAFHISILQIHSPKRKNNIDHQVDMYPHYGFEGPISLPAYLMNIIESVIGIDNRNLGQPGAASGDPANAVAVSIVAAAQRYRFPNTGAAGVTVAIFADASGTAPAAFSLPDITALINNQLPGYRTQPVINEIRLTVGATTYKNNPVLITGSTPAKPVPVGALELTGDISFVSVIAQGVTINVYFSEMTEAGMETFLNRVIIPDPAEAVPSVLTTSWVYFDETFFSAGAVATISNLYRKAAARGVTAFSAAGDWGANNNVGGTDCHLGYPSSEPWSTVCGGTIIGTDNNNNPVEVVWSDVNNPGSLFGGLNLLVPSAFFGATGGGVSSVFPVQPWQTAAGVNPSSLNEGNAKGRGVPDVAAMVSYTGLVLNGKPSNFIGTSAVAPLYAGLAAVINQAMGRNIGFLNPTLYIFHDLVCNDVVNGNNDSALTPDAPFYTAGPGWDPCTGWGSIDGDNLINVLMPLQISIHFEGSNDCDPGPLAGITAIFKANVTGGAGMLAYKWIPTNANFAPGTDGTKQTVSITVPPAGTKFTLTLTVSDAFNSATASGSFNSSDPTIAGVLHQLCEFRFWGNRFKQPIYINPGDGGPLSPFRREDLEVLHTFASGLAVKSAELLKRIENRK